MTVSESNEQKLLQFSQNATPPLKSGEYQLTVTQKVSAGEGVDMNGLDQFSASQTFAVPGNRFQLNDDDIVSVFPPPLANGEFGGCMPLVTLKRITLPWQRSVSSGESNAPWLALLVFMESEQPPPLQINMTATDLVTLGDTITVTGSDITGTGTMPAKTFSYPGFNQLDYGQYPNDPCTVIDVPVSMFSKVCPSAKDLPFLAHVRETDTWDSVDSEYISEKVAVVLANRWPAPGSDQSVKVYTYLVSLENLGDYLPDDNGTISPALLATKAENVRLLCYRSWHFTVNSLKEKFKELCEHLNRDAKGDLTLTTLRLPATMPTTAPTERDVHAALDKQLMGQLTDKDASVLVDNGLSLGYTALNHHLRKAGSTVSWYRGPLLPCKIQPTASNSAACSDALLRYDPQTGLFDTSYAQAWQLGQLLALANKTISVAIYNWKHAGKKALAMQKEMAQVNEKLADTGVFTHFFSQRSAKWARFAQTPPANIADWLGQLQLLKGVPLSALVPDERMLPVESLRFFSVDQNWIDALTDGALSIGGTGSAQTNDNADAFMALRKAAQHSARMQRKNNRPSLAAKLANRGDRAITTITGCLLRSSLVAGWPKLQIKGYSDKDRQTLLPLLRMEQLSNDLLICLFEGELATLTLHEPPMQLHCGVQLNEESHQWSTTLRDLTDAAKAGQQLGNAILDVSVRPDNQTLRTAQTAAAIQAQLAVLGQDVQVTSAEFAVEMALGTVEVVFQNGVQQ